MRRKDKDPEAPANSGAEPKRLTPVEIQQKEFRLALRGYNERDVDQFLDELTEEVARLYAENKRLTEDASFTRTTRLDVSAAAEAEDIVRRAREEAARIIGDARARTAMAPDPSGGYQQPQGAAAGPPVEIRRMLARERAFLQNLASLIQAHAEGVKEDVRRVRVSAGPAPVVPETESAPEPTSAEEPPDAGVEEPTRAWNLPGDEDAGHQRAGFSLDQGAAGPGGAPRSVSEVGTSAAGRVDQLVDLTAEERTADTDEAHAVRPTWQAGPAHPGESAEGPEEPSIRELFWGEE